MADIAPHNDCMRSLTPEDLGPRCRPTWSPVELRLAEVLYEMEAPAKWVYFPKPDCCRSSR